MRSYFVTFVLILATCLTVGLAAMYFGEGDLSRVLGQPTTKIGEPLYDFDPQEVTDIYLAGNKVGAHCQRTANGWQMVSPWADRMDPRAAQHLMAFVLGTRVEGGIPTDKLESSAIAFEDGRIALRFANAVDDPLAKFWIGHQTPWFGTDEETGDPIPTVFVAPRDRSRKDYVYACTDRQDIHQLLGDGFRRLRDHHPFLFHPNIVEHLRIKSSQGEMLLAQSSPGLWSITKPLDLKADPESVRKLLQGLYDLEAVRVHNRDEVTLPAENGGARRQIAFKFFTSEEEVVLDIFAPETEVSQTVMAVVSDRPTAVFELPWVKPANPEIQVALSDLPLSVNALRDPTLTSIAPEGIRSIFISPATGEDIRITRSTPKERFALLVEGQPEEPNETALYALISSVSEAKVAEFVSDSATDLSPYGLDQPFLVLRFRGFDDSSVELRFGEDKQGAVHAIRSGTTTVVRIDPALLNIIPTRLWEWRSPQIWKISQPDVAGLARVVRGGDQEQFVYDFAADSWTAAVDGADRSLELNSGRANQLLKRLLELKASHWLPPGQIDAASLSKDPDVVIEMLVRRYNEDAEFAGVQRVQLVVQGNMAATNLRPDAFLLDPAVVQQLKVDLFELE